MAVAKRNIPYYGRYLVPVPGRGQQNKPSFLKFCVPYRGLQHDENNVHWACYAIELDFSYNYPIISVLRDKPGELGRIGPITGSEEEIWARLTAGPWRRMPYVSGFT